MKLLHKILSLYLNKSFVLIAFIAPWHLFAQEKALESQFGSSSVEWKKTISLLAKEPLWNDRDAYDASHSLMVPMHYAFFNKDEQGILEFELLMARFALNELPGGQLNQAQWMYLVSRYLALRSQTGIPLAGTDAYLLQRLSLWLHNRWLFEPAYQWERVPFFGTKERLAHLESPDAKFNANYYRAVLDYELFLFSIAGDLSNILETNRELSKTIPESVKSTIKEALVTGIQIILSRGSFTRSGGWLFQVGMWADHPDYMFAGHTKLEPNLRQKPLKGLAEDSSHSHRWPLFFVSLMNAHGVSPADKSDIQNAYKGFCSQFKSVVIKVDGKKVLLKNYMDGHNGVYRYKYATVGKNTKLGYGPYALSGILGMSWYPFCSDVNEVFEKYRKTYPLSQDVIDIYTGPNTTRDMNPIFRWPGYFANGFAQMQASQSAFVSKFMNK